MIQLTFGFSLTPITSRTDTLLAPLVVVPNLALTGVYAAVTAVAKMTEVVSTAADGAGVPLAGLVADATSRIGARAQMAAGESIHLMTAGLGGGSSSDTRPSRNALLATTMLDKMVQVTALPLSTAWDGTAAVVSTPPSQRALRTAALLAARAMAPLSWPGVLPGDLGLLTAARTRLGFAVMFFNGGGAVVGNARGMIGGLLALMFGDSAWLAEGLKKFRGYAEYVYEKELHHELGPGSKFPMSKQLVAISAEVMQTYPDEFVLAMEREGLVEGSRLYLEHRRALHRMLALYVLFTARMMYDVVMFFGKGVFDGPDAQKVAICELAIMRSALTGEEKEAALFELRKTAPNAIIEFEHYVSLLVPYDGTVKDKVYRRKASGEIFDTLTVVPSIFDKHAIAWAQSTNAEAISLRSFLWLYRDEQTAREENERETWRKFGPETVRRIAERPLYPLSAEEIAELTKGGPRPSAAVAAIQDQLLRERGLDEVADMITAGPSRAVPRAVRTSALGV